MTLSILESLVEGKLEFKPMGDLEGIEYAPIEGFEAKIEDEDYRKVWLNSIDYRIKFVESLSERDRLPAEALDRLKDFEKILSK